MTALDAPPPQRLVPAWLERLAAVGWRALATAAFGLVLLAIAIGLSTVTASVLVALIVAAALVPIVEGLRRRGASPTLAAAIACLAGLLVFALVTVVLVLALVPYVREVIGAVETGVRDLREQLSAVGAPPLVSQAFDEFVESLLSLLSIDPRVLLGPIAALTMVGILGGFLTFFLLQDGTRGWAWLMRPLAGWRAELVTVSARSGLERVSGYLQRTALLAVSDALVVGVTLVLLGMPLVGPLVVLVFVGGFVPYLGAIITASIVVLATLALAGPAAGAVVLAAIIAASIAGPQALARTALGTRVDVHPVVVLAAIPAGATLFGLLGLVAVLPVTVFVLAVGRPIVLAIDLGPSGPGRASDPAALAGVPVWLDRLGQWSWRGLVVASMVGVVVALAVRVPAVVLPGVLALVLAATLAPLAARLRRRGWSSTLAASAATVGATLGVAVALVGSIALTIGPLREIVDTALDGATATTLGWLVDLVKTVGSGLVLDLGGLIGGLVYLGLTILLALLLTFFFLRDGPAWWHGVIGRLPASRRERVDAVGTDTVGVLGGYMVGTTLISLFGAVTSTLIMLGLGLPLAIPVGVLTFFSGFIPYIGSFVTTALATLIAVAVGSTTDVIVMGVFTIVFNIVQGNFVTPLVYGRTLNLHPAVILLAIPAGNQIAGILGMFLVVPFVAVVAATWRPLLELIGPDPSNRKVVAAAAG